MPKPKTSRLFFDHQDYELLNIVNEVLDKDNSLRYLKKLFVPYFHPHGIKEMAADRELRVAYAVVHLLGSLEEGMATDRLRALRSLRDEMLFSAVSGLRRNTARVLISIVKELLRSQGNPSRQLELAHDFRKASLGKPRLIREMLRRYHLLEMPEEWNHIAFDHHVHDANTKGRKTPTHLVMDAWIKGIRELTVIYYNYVRPEVAAELVEAAEMMEIKTRIGVELWAPFRNRYVQLIWVPRGFADTKDFLDFLSEDSTQGFMEKAREASRYQQRYVFDVLQEFNKKHRLSLNEAFGMALPELDPAKFLCFVGRGQASVLHLGEFIHSQLLSAMQARVEEFKVEYNQASKEERAWIVGLVAQMNSLSSEEIVERYLRPEDNPGVMDPHVPRDEPDVPAILKLTPYGLIEELKKLTSGYRITLNLSGLSTEDVLELLYDCRGEITHLEIFNLKDQASGKTANRAEIDELRRAINEGNVIALKRFIRKLIARVETSSDPDAQSRLEKLKAILKDIGTLRGYYRESALGARIGSDSTGRSLHIHGMGFAVKQSLPHRSQRQIERDDEKGSRDLIPFQSSIRMQRTFQPPGSSEWIHHPWLRWMLRLPGFHWVGWTVRNEWMLKDLLAVEQGQGDLATLGGLRGDSGNGLSLENAHKPFLGGRSISGRYLNTGLKNALKMLGGFIPAFLTFFLTKDWWVLAYGGAFVWFGITGFRNVVQSVLGGGGFKRSPLLRWKSYVSWERVADSMLFTGFSVPILDTLMKTLVLERGFGVTVGSAPTLLYAGMALANGIYLASHNIYRGLPRTAVLGNLFRNILSIPLAIGFNTLLGQAMTAAGVLEVSAILQKWAAVISKAASDCVAGVIEGLADRYHNIQARSVDYAAKLSQLFETYSRLELLFPEADVGEMLESPKEFTRVIRGKGDNLVRIMIINSLDLLYFWMYQPRARSALVATIRSMSPEERLIFYRMQTVLTRQREISQLFVDGIVGKNFSRGLSFYLDRSEGYLAAMKKLTGLED